MPVGPNSGPSESRSPREARCFAGSSAPSVACTVSVLPLRTISRSTFDPGFESLMSYFLFNDSPRTRDIIDRLQDVGERRLADMAASGIDHQLISLTAPGLQIFDTDTAVGLQTDYNDALAAAVAAHPGKFSALAAIATRVGRPVRASWLFVDPGVSRARCVCSRRNRTASQAAVTAAPTAMRLEAANSRFGPSIRQNNP